MASFFSPQDPREIGSSFFSGYISYYAMPATGVLLDRRNCVSSFSILGLWVLDFF